MNQLPSFKMEWLKFKNRIVDLQHGKKQYNNVLITDIDIDKRTIFFREDYGRGRQGMASGGVMSMVEVQGLEIPDTEEVKHDKMAYSPGIMGNINPITPEFFFRGDIMIIELKDDDNICFNITAIGNTELMDYIISMSNEEVTHSKKVDRKDIEKLYMFLQDTLGFDREDSQNQEFESDYVVITCPNCEGVDVNPDLSISDDQYYKCQICGALFYD